MGMIDFDFELLTNLSPFVSAPIAGTDPVQWTESINHMPDEWGMYLLHNRATSSYYIGIAQSFNNRFATRHESAVHLGLPQSEMQNIAAYMGRVSAVNQDGHAANVQFGVGSYQALVDGQVINLEKLLIHAFLDIGFQGLTYNTNTMLAANRFRNDSDYELVIKVSSLVPNVAFFTDPAQAGPMLLNQTSPNVERVTWTARIASGADQFILDQ